MVQQWIRYAKARKTATQTKRGAVALEVIIISGILLALTVGIISSFSNTVNSGGTNANQAILEAVGGKPAAK